MFITGFIHRLVQTLWQGHCYCLFCFVLATTADIWSGWWAGKTPYSGFGGFLRQERREPNIVFLSTCSNNMSKSVIPSCVYRAEHLLWRHSSEIKSKKNPVIKCTVLRMAPLQMNLVKRASLDSWLAIAVSPFVRNINFESRELSKPGIISREASGT